MTMPKNLECKECSKTFTKRYRNQKYCSKECAKKVKSRLMIAHYHKHKNEPKYKKIAYERFKKWRIKNREHFNDLVRAKSREWQRKKRLKIKMSLANEKLEPQSLKTNLVQKQIDKKFKMRRRK